MNGLAPKVVFDCVIFAQAVINDAGPSGACLELARTKAIQLFWSEYVLAEIRELPGKLPLRLLVTSDRVEAFIADVAAFAETIAPVPSVYENPFDADDSHYVDLAVAASASVITTRDRHLLDLMDGATPQGSDFHARFPQIEIITPHQLLERIRKSQ